MRLKNKVAVITGGGTGLGREAALLFAKEGAKVVIGCRKDHGQETVDMISKMGGDALFIRTDLREEAQVQNLIKGTVDKYGRLDIIDNNSAVNHFAGPTPDIKLLNHSIAVNLAGPYLMCKYGIPEMIKNGGGSVINFASVVALAGETRISDLSYSLSKGGVVAFTREIAVHYAKDGIRCNCIAPTAILTEPVVKALEDPKMAWSIEKTRPPMGRFGKPIEVAYLVLFLASEESSYITGVTIPIDGGFTAM